MVDKSEVKSPLTAIPVSEDKSIILDLPNENSTKEFNPIKKELESFFNSILSNEPVKVTLEEGKEALEVADKIINIIQSNNK